MSWSKKFRQREEALNVVVRKKRIAECVGCKRRPHTLVGVGWVGSMKLEKENWFTPRSASCFYSVGSRPRKKKRKEEIRSGLEEPPVENEGSARNNK